MRISGQGVLLSLAASVLFVTLPGYVHLLEPLDSLQVVAHRVVWSIPMVFLLVVATRQWPTLRAAWRRLFAEPWLLACFPLTAAMMLLQWGIFIWAPLAGKTLELSLGYFLLPLAMVLVGRVFYGERLTPLQAIAVACALAGVLHEFWLTRAFSWVSLVTALGYPRTSCCGAGWAWTRCPGSSSRCSSCCRWRWPRCTGWATRARPSARRHACGCCCRCWG